MNTTDFNIFDEISNGKYNNKMEERSYPSKPEKPAIFDMKIGDMTEDQLSFFAKARKEYNKSMKKYEEDISSFKSYCEEMTKENDRLFDLFKVDCQKFFLGEENNSLTDYQKNILFSFANQTSSSESLEDIAYSYSNVCEFYKNMTKKES